MDFYFSSRFQLSILISHIYYGSHLVVNSQWIITVFLSSLLSTPTLSVWTVFVYQYSSYVCKLSPIFSCLLSDIFTDLWYSYLVVIGILACNCPAQWFTCLPHADIVWFGCHTSNALLFWVTSLAWTNYQVWKISMEPCSGVIVFVILIHSYFGAVFLFQVSLLDCVSVWILFTVTQTESCDQSYINIASCINVLGRKHSKFK